MCRQAHGAAFVTWVGVDADSFRLTAGAEKLAHYQSSTEATRSFCRRCGSTLLFESSRWPGEVHVARACIPGEIDREPAAHVFFDHRAPWVQVADELAKLGGESGTEPFDVG